MSSMSVFDCITESMAAGDRLVLAIVVGRSGSAPRSAGARMAVRKDGSIVGTIGGGILEAWVQGLAQRVFRDGRAVLEDFEFTSDDAALMGMICGGRVQVLVHCLDGTDPSQAALYREVRSASKGRSRAWLVTRLPRENGTEIPVEQALFRVDGPPVGSLSGERLKELVLRTKRNSELVQEGEDRFFIEPLGHWATLFIFGAGHVASELAPLAAGVGFRTVVLDDRREFANRDRFACADEVVVLQSFDSAMKELDIHEDSYLVLVTRGHQHDGTLLRQALHTNARYIGMIGSRRKRDAIYELLRREGFTNRDFDRVRCPVGIEIGAETPEEIAVSITAELIRERSEKSG